MVKDKSKFKVGDMVILTKNHINASGYKNLKGTRGRVTFKFWSVGMREWAYDIQTWGMRPLSVPESSLKKSR